MKKIQKTIAFALIFSLIAGMAGFFITEPIQAAEGVTIALDPGHGGTAAGAIYGTILEKDLNLKLAQYAKAELETYEGVTVVMTRTADTSIDLQARAQLAYDQGADILVSLHNNASGTGTAQGAEVFVTVSENFRTSSTTLANLILTNLKSLGLTSRGVKTKEESTGSGTDYYGIIRYSVALGFPAILVEHCFMDNPAEYEKYLSTDAKLQQLALADAKALADYYGLEKKGTVKDPVPVTGIVVSSPSAKVAVNGSVQLSAAVQPADADNSSIIWSVADGTGSATISPSGVLTGVKAGTVTVTATAADGSGVKGSLVLTIYQPVTSISVTGLRKATSVKVNRTLQMVATVLPTTAGNKAVTWTVVGGTGSATISSTGILKGVKAGTVTVTATAVDGSGIQGSVTIKVTK